MGVGWVTDFLLHKKLIFLGPFCYTAELVALFRGQRMGTVRERFYHDRRRISEKNASAVVGAPAHRSHQPFLQSGFLQSGAKGPRKFFEDMDGSDAARKPPISKNFSVSLGLAVQYRAARCNGASSRSGTGGRYVCASRRGAHGRGGHGRPRMCMGFRSGISDTQPGLAIQGRHLGWGGSG